MIFDKLYHREWRRKNPEKHRASQERWKKANPDKVLESARRYRRENPEKTKAAGLAWRKANPLRVRVSKYGLSIEQYWCLVKSQNGVCAICLKSKQLSVDHCHNTGKVRGLLCKACNTSIAQLGDSAEGVMRAVVYLDN